MSTILDKEYCTLDRANSQRDLLYMLTFGFAFANTFFMAGYVNVWLLAYLKSIIPSITGDLLPTNAWIAALTEPFTTKLFFGIAAYGMFRIIVDERCLDFNPHRLWLGASGGLVMGIAEVYLKLFNLNTDVITPFFWEHPAFSQVILLPLILHTVNGFLIVGTLFSVLNDGRFSSRDLITLTGAIVVSSGIHFVWNTWFITVIV